MVTAITTFCTEPPVTAIRAIARRMAGMDMIPSMIRIVTPSTRRSEADSRPMAVPISEDSRAAEKPTPSEMRPP